MLDTNVINVSAARKISFGFEAGLRVPELAYLKSLGEMKQKALFDDPNWAIYTDEGIAVKESRHRYSIVGLWENGSLGFQHVIINDNALLSGGQGDLLDANAVTIFKNIHGIAGISVKKIERELNRKEYVERSFVEISLGVCEGEHCFHGISFGLVPDYVVALCELYGVKDTADVGSCFDAELQQNFVSTLRLHAYPYDEIENVSVVENTPERLMAGMKLVEFADGYLVVGSGSRIYDAWRNLYKSINQAIRLYGVCYRVDGDRMAKEVYREMKRSWK